MFLALSLSSSHGLHSRGMYVLVLTVSEQYISPALWMGLGNAAPSGIHVELCLWTVLNNIDVIRNYRYLDPLAQTPFIHYTIRVRVQN